MTAQLYDDVTRAGRRVARNRGLHEHKLAELAKEAGFSSCRKLPLENPFNNLYELKP
jgi:hypothetical protein